MEENSVINESNKAIGEDPFERRKKLEEEAKSMSKEEIVKRNKQIQAENKAKEADLKREREEAENLKKQREEEEELKHKIEASVEKESVKILPSLTKMSDLCLESQVLWKLKVEDTLIEVKIKPATFNYSVCINGETLAMYNNILDVYNQVTIRTKMVLRKKWEEKLKK